MFDQLKGFGAIAGLMKDLPRLKARVEEMKAELEHVRVDAETGGGAVRAHVNGHMRVLEVEIDTVLIATLVDATDPDDCALASDLIVGAVNAAMEKAREHVAERMQAAASEMGVPLPPGAIDGLMG